MKRPHLFLLSTAILVATACSPVLQVEPAPAYEPNPAAVGTGEVDRFWWQLRFKLVWPEGEQPDFSRHLLVAEQLLLPVIVEHRAGMPLWRFHRRAARTPAGNQFSLLFFSDRDTASAIHEQVASDPLTGWLTDQGLIERVRFDQRSPEELGRLELTSDENWPLEIQQSWPYFIMGASQAWLMQVQALSAAQGLDGSLDYPSLLDHYREVDTRLNTQWRENGQHAYLHHLNAIYGYQPLFIELNGLETF
jgi:hypothetical protein